MTIHGSNCSVVLTRVARRLLVGLLFAVCSGANASTYAFSDLGSGIAYDINFRGQVVGTSEGQATVWNGTTRTYLGSGTAYDINNRGQVVGTSLGQATLWNGTTAAYLGSGSALGMNDRGQIVGESNGQATLWNGTTPTYLGMLAGATSSYANDINFAGRVVGSSVLAGEAFGNRATRWRTTTPIELDTLGGESVATAINDLGSAVGFGYLPNNVNSRALLWGPVGTLTELDNLAGNSSFAMDINNLGQAVGWSFTVDSQIGQHAALWNGTSVTDLNTFLDPDLLDAGWYLYDARAINDRGWITGTARNDWTHESHAYVLTPIGDRGWPRDAVAQLAFIGSPVPEPQTYAMMALGLAMVGFAVKRRQAANTRNTDQTPT
jgi:probable HAF family extracellular repeat protein